MLKLMCSMVLSLACFPTPSLAQQSGIDGQWQCQHGNQSVTNNNFENWLYQFDLFIDPGGAFQANGVYTAASAGFSVPFQAQGNWQQAQQGVVLQGGEQRQDGTQQQFTLVFTVLVPNSMSQRMSTPNGTLATYCQR